MKEKNKTLVVKGMPTKFTDDEFKEILDSNKIQYANAERMKSRRDGRSLQMFQIELKDPAEAEAIISENLTCPQTRIIFKVEKFRTPISVRHFYNITAKSSNTRQKIVRPKTKCVIRGKGHSHKGSQIEKKQPKCAIVEDHMLLNTKVVQPTKKQVFRQHVVDNQNVMPPF